MSEPISITVIIASIGSLCAILCDKMKSSRCNRIICPCCEIDRVVLKEPNNN